MGLVRLLGLSWDLFLEQDTEFLTGSFYFSFNTEDLSYLLSCIISDKKSIVSLFLCR